MTDTRLMGISPSADFIEGRRVGKREGIEVALAILDDYRARENDWLERARKGDVAPKANAADIADDARSREAVLRGAAADIRALLTELG